MPAFKRVFVVFVLVAFLIFPQKVLSYFSDDFTGNSLNTDTWQSFANSGQIVVGGGKLTLLRSNVKSNSFPYLYSKTNLFPESGSYSIRIGYKYLSVGNFGDGITISTDGVPANGADPGSNISSFITFSLWQTLPDGLYFQKVLCNVGGIKCNQIEFINTFTHSSDFNPHEVRIDYSDQGQYLIYLDGSRIPKYISDINQKRPKKIWIGNSLTTNTLDFWSSFEVDYIHVVPFNEKFPIIFIPGFGASWDMPALLAGTEGTDWAIPSYVKNYNGIIKSFKNAGYVEGTNLFVFPYDWRKNLDRLADDLNSFIESKNLGADKFDIVGHSMGGLVARAYAQKYGLAKIDKILTAGSPHFGVIDMYGLWEGAKTWDDVWWEKVLLEIASEVNKLPGETSIDAIRRVSPSIIDLFPTNSFLISNGVPVGIDAMNQRNSRLNQYTSNFEGKLIPFWSDDISTTKRTINIISPNPADILDDKWEDGKPVDENPFGTTTGDGTVTKESAVGQFGTGEKLSGWHSDLLSSKSNVEKIFQTLGLNPDFAEASETDDRKNSFVAILRSPGELEVCNKSLTLCDDQLGMYFPDYKLFILPGYNDEGLVVKVREIGQTGTYKLHLGNIDETSKWIVEDGDLQTSGQTDFYGVKNDGGGMSVTLDNIPPSVEISSPQELVYQSAKLPQLTYTITDNWDTSPSVHTEGWSDTEGVHTVKVTATDKAGNVRSKSVTYWVDDTSPTIDISSPIAKTYTPYELPSFDYTVTDNQDTDPKIEESERLQTDGEHIFTVTATDKAGNTSIKSVTYTVILDHTPPVVSITSPLPKTYQSDDLPLLVYDVSDDWDGHPVTKEDVLSKTEGIHTIYVRAIDMAGNIGVGSVTYTIQNPPSNKDQCKNNLWKLFRLLGFKNQGSCVSFVEANEKRQKFNFFAQSIFTNIREFFGRN